jgi:hypothetical protein
MIAGFKPDCAPGKWQHVTVVAGYAYNYGDITVAEG